ncbi:MAG: outer membrane lipoprotein carrier protein LolA [Myxococcota bacterium]|jgi:outer membrane lipoprotein-sorting protein|nr:outer membrane lipoprotein carrier protein LolA [Myxococcota bacterium]
MSKKNLCAVLFLLASLAASLRAETDGVPPGASRLSAHFVMERKMAALSSSVRSEGKVLLGGPGMVRFETLSPSKSILVVNKGKAWLSYPDLKVTRSFELASDPVMQVLTEHILALSAFDFGKLGALYEITDLGGGKKRLLPKQEAVRRVFGELKVALDSRGLATSVEMLSVSGDSTTIRFEKIDTQSNIAPAAFEAPR